MDSYCKTSPKPNFDSSDYETETKNLTISNFSNVLDCFGSSNQNVCAYCGFESYEPDRFVLIHINFRKLYRVLNDNLSSMHTNTQYLSSREADLISRKDKRILLQSYDEETSEWIFCDICRKWFHAK
jgi:hypothetical protein